jgi:hypothetical protein
MTPCKHENFDCFCNVARIEDIGRFSVDVTVKCMDCGTPFKFLGLPLGLDLNGACVNFDGTEARLAIAPKGEAIPPIHGVEGFTVRAKP